MICRSELCIKMTHFLKCSVISEEAVNCNGSIYRLPEKKPTYLEDEFWIYVGIYIGLVVIAGLMSGLTIGLMSLDPTTLAVLRDGGSAKEKRYAACILPLVSRHHLLLVTLLLANSAAVEAMPLFLDRVSDNITAIVVSVTAVLTFGEIIPQALFSRHGLALGAFLSPLVYLLMVLLLIIAWPISKILDCLLGSEQGTFFRRSHLKALVDLHGPAGHSTGKINASKPDDDEHLTLDEVLIIKGALDMKYKMAKNAMVPLADVFMLNSEDTLDYDIMAQITEKGHARIPIFSGKRSNVVSLLLTKSLISLNPLDEIPIKNIIDSPRHAHPVMFVDETTPLFDLLNQFQTGKSHLAMVRRSPPEANPEAVKLEMHSDKQPLVKIEDEAEEIPGEVIGIITLEDVIEELLQEEINDERDFKPLPEMTDRLQLALAKVVNIHKGKLQRCKSQPQEVSHLGGHGDIHVVRQLSSSLQAETTHSHDMSDGRTKDSHCPSQTCVTFE